MQCSGDPLLSGKVHRELVKNKYKEEVYENRKLNFVKRKSSPTQNSKSKLETPNSDSDWTGVTLN